MDEEIRKVQSIQLDMMKKLHQVCMENNITYILMGGSLLGAVRHQGFIPWDDDFDIALLRTDYDKLIKVLKENPIDGCFLQTYSTDAHYVQPYAKLRKNNTRFVEKYFQGIKMHEGIFIDIFPFDKIPTPNSRAAKIRKMSARFLTFVIWRKEGAHVKRKGIKNLEIVLSSCIGIFPKSIIISLQNKLVYRENKNWPFVASMYSSNYKISQTYMKRKDFLDVILMDYEDTKFYVPRKWDELLTRIYRNYMELPPEKKRNSGHDVVRIETE